MKWDDLADEQCAVSRTLSVIGDRWTLIILSDCFLGVKKFESFMERLQISRTTLGDRLASLVEHGVLTKVPYQHRPLRHDYRLTSKGLGLYPIIAHMIDWGNQYYGDVNGPPILLTHKKCGGNFQPQLHCGKCGEETHISQIVATARPEKRGVPPVMRVPIRE